MASFTEFYPFEGSISVNERLKQSSYCSNIVDRKPLLGRANENLKRPKLLSRLPE